MSNEEILANKIEQYIKSDQCKYETLYLCKNDLILCMLALRLQAIDKTSSGASDDVCEWEKGFSGYVGYPAYYSKCCSTKSKGLEMQTHIIADWKYCPYCGKKIKIVGD